MHPTSHIVDYPSSLVSGSPVSGLPIANYAKAAVSQDNEHDTADPLQIDMDQVRQPHLQSFPTEKLEKISRPAIQQPPSTTQPDPLPATAPAQPHKVAVMKPGNRSKAHQRNALSSAVTDSFLRRMEETLSSDEEPFLPQGGPSPLLPSAGKYLLQCFETATYFICQIFFQLHLLHTGMALATKRQDRFPLRPSEEERLYGVSSPQ